jgi:hypothetical protein
VSMMRLASPIVVATCAASFSHARSPRRVIWDYYSVPITIEVLQDVPVRPCGAERGVLCARGDLIIPRGERFQMLEVGIEGGCVIEYRGNRYESSSCPWVKGFTDAQTDIFMIVEVPEKQK